jgi:hypothetical protein
MNSLDDQLARNEFYRSELERLDRLERRADAVWGILVLILFWTVTVSALLGWLV